jgi:retron-type reverse transcriptase
MKEGVVWERDKGTPQGGPLLPLLSNIMLDAMDKELEKRRLILPLHGRLQNLCRERTGRGSGDGVDYAVHRGETQV